MEIIFFQIIESNKNVFIFLFFIIILFKIIYMKIIKNKRNFSALLRTFRVCTDSSIV